MAVVTPSPSLYFHLTGGVNGSQNNNPYMSLGGVMARAILSDKLDNLFDPISSTQQNEGSIEYRWIILLNNGTEPLKSPHFYFSPKDPYIDIELSRLAVGAAVTILAHEDDRPLEEEIGPEIDVPMPFEKTTESYETTKCIGPNILPGGKLYICVRRNIPEGAQSENKAAVLVVESRVPVVTSSASEGGPEGDIFTAAFPTAGKAKREGSIF